MKRKLSVNNLSFAEIGGVGEMVYKAVHFADYGVTNLHDRDWIAPTFPSPLDPMKSGKDDKLTGQELLTSICNLYHKMNDPGEKIDRNRELIVWCRENVHPYDIDSLCALAEELEPGTDASTLIQHDAIFEPEKFIDDMCEVGRVFDYAFALIEIKENGNTVPARRQYYEGRICDGFPFFEKYRDIEDDDKYVESVLDDFSEHTERLIDLIPDFRMRLKLDRDSGKVMYGADVESVFDICWYTLSRIIADVAPRADQNPDELFSQGKILSCLACGKFFVRHSSRQLYCDNPSCQAERNRRNRRASYARKKAAEVQNKAKNNMKRT